MRYINLDIKMRGETIIDGATCKQMFIMRNENGP